MLQGVVTFAATVFSNYSEENLFCLWRRASSSIRCVRPTWREGRPFIGRRSWRFSWLLQCFSAAVSMRTESCYAVFFFTLCLAHGWRLSARRLNAKGRAGEALPLLPQRLFAACLVRNGWIGFSSWTRLVEGDGRLLHLVKWEELV